MPDIDMQITAMKIRIAQYENHPAKDSLTSTIRMDKAILASLEAAKGMYKVLRYERRAQLDAEGWVVGHVSEALHAAEAAGFGRSSNE